ncbi:MAG TPA: hemerythrin domain-containing protein [Rhodanobacteraceae bacterium]|nr:hemerythrin domain-containing protein [Rhodanobacteraceae bacterium]
MSKNAIQMLKDDHDKVDELFKKCEKAEPNKQKQIAQQICDELKVHSAIEEEVFYPAADKALGSKERSLVDEALVEHASLANLIANIEDDMSAKLFTARLTVLKEYVQHHVKEEENEIMPKVAKADLDLEALGKELQTARTKAKSDLGITHHASAA